MSHYIGKMISSCSVSLLWLLFFQLSDFAGFRKSTKTSSSERERACFFLYVYTNSIFIPCLTCMPYRHNQPLRDSILSYRTQQDLCWKRRNIRVGFCNNELPAVPQPRPISACVCFRYCSSGNYRRWYGGLLHSAAYVSTGARFLPRPPTQRQWVHTVVL